MAKQIRLTESDIARMVESVLNEIGNTKPMRWMLGRLARRQDLRRQWKNWEEADDEFRDRYPYWAPKEFPKGKIKHTTSDAVQFAKDNGFYTTDDPDEQEEEVFYSDDKSFEHGRRYRDFDYWRANHWDDYNSGESEGRCYGYGQAMMAAIKDYLATHGKKEINESVEGPDVIKTWSSEEIAELSNDPFGGQGLFAPWVVRASRWGAAVDNLSGDNETPEYPPVKLGRDGKFYVYSESKGRWLCMPFRDKDLPDFIKRMRERNK